MPLRLTTRLPPTWTWLSPAAQHEMAKICFKIIFHELRKVFQLHKSSLGEFHGLFGAHFIWTKILTPDINK